MDDMPCPFSCNFRLRAPLAVYNFWTLVTQVRPVTYTHDIRMLVCLRAHVYMNTNACEYTHNKHSYVPCIECV
jgi:hypothetical protein